ncbi:MAG: type IX secretion system outer membrane channel protein PorV [Weeksellaceae bacterium]|nr:type IX secretion system outer membrane channel protein PorV [Weeksellaceae bacterium]
MKSIKKLLLLAACGMTFIPMAAQEGQELETARYRPVLTGAPFLRISPDARAGGLGDMGVATSTDAFSQYWNPAKYVFSRNFSGVGVSYTPYLSAITDDVFLLNASFYTFLGDEERSTIAASIYYFNAGQVDLTQIVGNQFVNIGQANPNEFSVDVSYGLKLTDFFGMAVAARYIRSDLFNNDQDPTTKAGNSFAVDVAGFYESPRISGNTFDSRIRAGFNVSNVGPKLSYSDSEESESFLPTNLRLGAGYDFILDDYNRVSVGAEVNKLLVPTPNVPIRNAAGDIVYYDVPNVGVVSGIFQSFSDAPGGFSEELKEFTWALSAEYVYNNAFAFRAGYFNESMEKGARQYATLGAGLAFNAFGLDLSYLIPTNNINNALENTLRFSLTWNFGGETYSSYDY